MKQKIDFDKQISECESERQLLFKQKEPIDERLLELYDKISSLKEQRDTYLIKQTKKFKFPNFDIMLNMVDESTASYREGERQLELLGLGSAGYHLETMQTAVRISLFQQYNEENKKRNLKTFNGLKKILPHIKPIDGKKVVAIFEHTLSQYGSWSLLFHGNENDTVELHNSYRVQKSFKNLKEALDYCQKYHYYE